MPIYGDQPSTLGDIKEELLARLQKDHDDETVRHKTFAARCLGFKGNSILLEKSNGDIELSSIDKYINISVLDERCAVVDRAWVE
jgi:hypothetical protein